MDARQQRVEHPDLVARARQQVDNVGPDKPGAAGHEESHGLRLRTDAPGNRPGPPLSSVCKEACPCPGYCWRPRVIHSVSISSRPDTQPRSPDVSDPARIRLPWRPLPAWRQGAPRAVRLAAALAGLAVIITYLVIALSRLTYPFTVEWLESNSLVEVHRILAGQPLYPAPTAGYVPDGYPPLYFAVSAAAASVLGVSYLPLRLVSLVSSLVCFAAARPAGPARDGKPRGRDRRRGRVRLGLLRHPHLVRRRPGRLAVPGAQHRRPVRRPVDEPHPRRHRVPGRCWPPRRSPSRPGSPRGSWCSPRWRSARAAGSPASPR